MLVWCMLQLQSFLRHLSFKLPHISSCYLFSHIIKCNLISSFYPSFVSTQFSRNTALQDRSVPHPFLQLPSLIYFIFVMLYFILFYLSFSTHAHCSITLRLIVLLFTALVPFHLSVCLFHVFPIHYTAMTVEAANSSIVLYICNRICDVLPQRIVILI